jgi:hypothetical protein
MAARIPNSSILNKLLACSTPIYLPCPQLTWINGSHAGRLVRPCDRGERSPSLARGAFAESLFSNWPCTLQPAVAAYCRIINVWSGSATKRGYQKHTRGQ